MAISSHDVDDVNAVASVGTNSSSSSDSDSSNSASSDSSLDSSSSGGTTPQDPLMDTKSPSKCAQKDELLTKEITIAGDMTNDIGDMTINNGDEHENVKEGGISKKESNKDAKAKQLVNSIKVNLTARADTDDINAMDSVGTNSSSSSDSSDSSDSSSSDSSSDSSSPDGATSQDPLTDTKSVSKRAQKDELLTKEIAIVED
eukprot:scaffold6661_cov133-Chaetoceros_neogracile.AAC.1